jgi:hypothetical protein
MANAVAEEHWVSKCFLNNKERKDDLGYGKLHPEGIEHFQRRREI